MLFSSATKLAIAAAALSVPATAKVCNQDNANDFSEIADQAASLVSSALQEIPSGALTSILDGLPTGLLTSALAIATSYAGDLNCDLTASIGAPNACPRSGKKVKRAELNCGNDDICLKLTDNSLMCLNYNTGNYQRSDGSKGNAISGVITEADGSVTTNTDPAALYAPTGTGAGTMTGSSGGMSTTGGSGTATETGTATGSGNEESASATSNSDSDNNNDDSAASGLHIRAVGVVAAIAAMPVALLAFW